MSTRQDNSIVALRAKNDRSEVILTLKNGTQWKITPGNEELPTQVNATKESSYDSLPPSVVTLWYWWLTNGLPKKSIANYPNFNALSLEEEFLEARFETGIQEIKLDTVYLFYPLGGDGKYYQCNRTTGTHTENKERTPGGYPDVCYLFEALLGIELVEIAEE